MQGETVAGKALNMGRTRKDNDPYLILTDPRLPGWEWRVLKAYTGDPDAEYARWFCVVRSPFTGSYGDMGDTYVADTGTIIKYRDPVVEDKDIPARLLPNGS